MRQTRLFGKLLKKIKKVLAFSGMACYYIQALRRYAAVAQLDRVTDYESVGRGFESLLPYHVGAKLGFAPTSFCFSGDLTRFALLRIHVFGVWKGGDSLGRAEDAGSLKKARLFRA